MQKIRFLPEPENGFFNTLKNRVHNHFTRTAQSPYANTAMILKATLFIGIFISLYLIILTAKLSLGAFLLCWFGMGVFILLSAMSIVHDAAHGMISRKPLVNTMLLHFANLVGGDGYMYKYKHTVSHHPFTNIYGMDIDLAQSDLLKITPFSQSKGLHRFQGVYMKVLYPFFILFWVLFRDFKYYNLKTIGAGQACHKKVHWIILIISKIFYLFYMLAIPVVFADILIWKVLLGFICMHMGSGVIAMFGLLSNHAVEDSLFVRPDESGMINCTWGEHQLRTTDDYSPDSKIISFLFSGLNHHVAHHLFPKYSHIHYPAITKILRQTATEFGLRYRYNSITGGLASHFRLLNKQNKQNINYSNKVYNANISG
jgi:linoleoyl-CoA desaturase